MRRPPILLLVATLAAVALLAACSLGRGRSSQTRPSRTILETEYDDARVGAEVAESVQAQMGVIDDPKLNAYVNRVGRKLLRGVPRRAFSFEFYVVDQEEPNAFALPGGYIFISRGLLALANNEDELACVIGHEITHSARRHAAAQQEVARRGGILARNYLRAGQIAAYGRDMERAADRGGQMLAAAAGYDPMGMSTFLASLEAEQRLQLGYKRFGHFFDTHPGSTERAATNAFRASEIRWRRDPRLGDTHKAHLRRIDGMALGQRPEGGVFDGNVFIHPDLDFQLRFPHDWAFSNTNQAVGAVAPDGNAVVFLMADMPAGPPKEVAEKFIEKSKNEAPVKVKESKPVRVGPFDAWRLRLDTRVGGRAVASTVTLIPYRGATWRITGMAPGRVAGGYEGRFLSTARSFRPLTEEERASVQATRLRIETARGGETLEALGKRTGNAYDPTRTAVLNGLQLDHSFEGGELVKIARVEPYVTPTPDSVPAE